MSKVATSIKINRIESSRINEVDFGSLKFGRQFSDHVFVAKYKDNEWTDLSIEAYDNLSLSPAASVFHYGQAIFEGLKAHRTENGEILLFRPDKNWERLNASAVRLCMPEIPESIFMDGVKELIHQDRNWVPNGENQSLYIRPFMIADEAFLGVKPSESYQFLVITSPTSNYYSGAIRVKIETQYSRAASGGIGAAKAAANYAASLYPAKQALEEGYDQLIWTDASSHQFIEESGTMNIMFKINGTLITPSTKSDTILDGVTRDSIIQLARHWDISVEERKISVDEILLALESNELEEAFGMGTAATIVPIQSIGANGKEYQLSDSSSWTFSNRAKDYLEKLKRGIAEDQFNWTVKI